MLTLTSPRRTVRTPGQPAAARLLHRETGPAAARPLHREIGNQAAQRLMPVPGPGPGRGEASADFTDDVPARGSAGRAEVPVGTPGPLQPGDTRAVPKDFIGPLQAGVARSDSFAPMRTVVTAGTPLSDCGAYTYKVKWGIPPVEEKTAGWVVQKVDIRYDVKDCAGNPVPPAPVDDPAGYPFWEAWEFTAGRNVWVGPAAGGTAHSGDTFSGGDYGPGTKGRISLIGEVKAIAGFTLPAGMTVRNASPAWSLPYTKAEPAKFAGTLPGAAHTLTAEWDCCPNGTVAKRTTVATNP